MSSLTTIAVPGAPKAIGPYAQGIVANGFLFTAGQVPLNPDTMTLVESPIAAQTERIFDNLEAIVTGAGTTLDRTVKATVYLMDMGDFVAMNEVFEKRFGGHRPARSTVQVSRLPAAARVEIDLVVAV